MGEIQVVFFAAARTASGCDSTRISCVRDEMDVAEFWDRILALYPALGPLRSSVRLARNLEYIGPGDRLRAGDEVALIPPVSGG